MANRFMELVEARAGTKVVLQGNIAFALGCARHGIHVADGYPGTPSTEVIDKGLVFARDIMDVNWSVNEAAAVASALGSAMAGKDAVVTMKVPGLFQAADIVSTMAFYHEPKGAVVLYVATDFKPSSTQHVVDPRYFLQSCCLPIIEPRNHKDIYQSGMIAADISRDFNTPVVVLASGLLCHSEGVVTLEERSAVEPQPLPDDLKAHLLLPSISRENYDRARLDRLPAISDWVVDSRIVEETSGTDDFCVISYGMNEIIVREALEHLSLNPDFLSVGMSNPLPYKRIVEFAAWHDNEVIVFEDGYRFVQDQLNLMGINARGKSRFSPNTDWSPETVVDFLTMRKREKTPGAIKAPKRPPNICAGCPYRALGESIKKLKKKGKIYAVFGDIGCNTLLMFLNAIDTCACMGASDNMRQGFIIGRPEMASRVLSVLGDSTECHSGLDATRNAVFRGIPGVKVILDNYSTAMTGGQPAPTSPNNLQGNENRFSLSAALRAEGVELLEVDAYDLKAVENTLKKSLEKAADGASVAVVVRGKCIRDVEAAEKIPDHWVDEEICKDCGLCLVCPGISRPAEGGLPQINHLCTNCGSHARMCVQLCKRDAFVSRPAGVSLVPGPTIEVEPVVPVPKKQTRRSLPESARLSTRGVGGQGILFVGKVLAKLALDAGYGESNIIKGETHGMAQLGGPVSSTFGCGKVYSPVFPMHSVDVLVALEMLEVLRDGFIDLLKPGGTIILNTNVIPPPVGDGNHIPSQQEVLSALKPHRVITFDGWIAAKQIGDRRAKSLNVLALGILSCITPFNAFSWSAWDQAITALSSSDDVALLNQTALEKGRSLGYSALSSTP